MTAAVRHRRGRPDLQNRVAQAWGDHPLRHVLSLGRQLVFYRQFHALVRTGISMSETLRTLATNAPSAAMRQALQRALKEVSRGATLSEAMRKDVGSFDEPSLELIAAGEETGHLEETLALLTNHLEELREMRRKAVLNSLYPLYLLCCVMLAGPLLGVAAAVAGGANVGDIPWLVAIGFLKNVFFLAAVVALVVGTPLAVAALDVEQQWEKTRFSLPLFGRAFRQLAAFRLLFALEIGWRGGLPVPRMLGMAARSASRFHIPSLLDGVIDGIHRGGSFTEAVNSFGLLSATTIGQIAVGEKTGTLEQTLGRLRKDHEAYALSSVRFIVIGMLFVIALLAMVTVVVKIIGGVMGGVADYFRAIGDN